MADEWRDIATAPREETILLFSPDAVDRVPMIGFYMGEDWYDFWGESVIDAWPTHWMPLPSPPIARRAE